MRCLSSSNSIEKNLVPLLPVDKEGKKKKKNKKEKKGLYTKGGNKSRVLAFDIGAKKKSSTLLVT